MSNDMIIFMAVLTHYIYYMSFRSIPQIEVTSMKKNANFNILSSALVLCFLLNDGKNKLGLFLIYISLLQINIFYVVILLYFLCSLFSLYSITIYICSVLCVYTYMSSIYFEIYVFVIHVYIDIIVILITTITHVHTRLYIKTFCVSNKFVCMQFFLDSNERVSIKICYSF